jgi:glycosyltransferase involved in cell wall biosynthesis
VLLMSAVPAQAGTGRIRLLEVVGNAIVGGMERCVERLIERLPVERFEVTVACPFDGAFAARLRELGAEVLIVPMPENPLWTSVQTLLQFVQYERVDLLHAHMANAYLLASLAGRLSGRPVMTTIHSRQLSTLDLEMHRLGGSHVSVVCKQSFFHALSLGVDPAKLSLEPNGVDIERFAPAPRPDRGALRTALGLAPDVPLAGYVGRLSQEKGPEVFLRAALPLAERLPQARMVLVGDGPMRGSLQHQIAQFGLQDRVFLAGEYDDMPAIYGELDVLVMSSHSEAMPLALLEGMSSALPVVATGVGGVPDMVEHGLSGWLVGDGDFEDMGRRCATLLENAEMRRSFGQRGRQRAMTQFGLADSTDRVAQLMTRLVTAEPAETDAASVSRLKTQASRRTVAMHAVDRTGR